MGDEDIEETTSETITETTEETTEPTWNYAEGIPGAGDKPEWFKGDKYSDITAQAKAYTDLEAKFGAFTGSPEGEYEITLSEELKESGIEINNEDPLYEEAVKFAKDSNMSQDGFNKMMELYGMAQMSEQAAMAAHVEEEIKSLGVNGQARIDGLNDWAKANLPDDLAEGFREMPHSAKAIEALEKVIGMTRGKSIDPGGEPQPGGVTEEELRAMQFEKDEYGNRRLQTDPAFRAKFKKLSAQLWGNEDHRVVVGGK